MKLLLIGAALITILTAYAATIPPAAFVLLWLASVLVIVQGGKQVSKQGHSW
jgi:hypothetical protein